MSRKKYKKEWYQRNKKRIYYKKKKLLRKLQAYVNKKKSVPCADCSLQYPYYVMDFDHVRGEKKFSLAAYRNYGRQTIKEEINKSDVVCANCHRERTHNKLADKQDLSLVSETVDGIAAVA